MKKYHDVDLGTKKVRVWEDGGINIYIWCDPNTIQTTIHQQISPPYPASEQGLKIEVKDDNAS